MQLTYELELLDELISEDLHPKKLIKDNPAISKTQVNSWIKKVSVEKNRVRKSLKPAVYTLLDEKHRQLFIRQNQSVLTRLLDTIFHYLSPKDASGMTERKTDSQLEKLYKYMYAYCLDLLNYIQDSFPEYFSSEMKMPEFELMRSQTQWKDRLIPIKKKLVKTKPDKKLSALLLEVLNNISDHALCVTLSYRTHDYINDLFGELENQKRIINIEGLRHPLTALLIYLDFNDTSFKEYLVEQICATANNSKTIKEKIDKLSFYYKEFGQLPKKKNTSLFLAEVSVKEDMKAWLAREIKYLEKSQNLGVIVPASFHSSSEYKRGIWYTYTIEELALMQRIQHDANYITNTNIIVMMQDLSKIAHTVKKHNISHNNLKNLFYKIDLDTIDSLHDKLLIMIRKLQDIKVGVIKKQKSKHR